jgi:gluconolactonase
LPDNVQVGVARPLSDATDAQRIDWSTFAVLPSGFTREPFGQSALATATHDGSEAIQYDAAKPFIAYSERFLNVTGRSPSLKVLSRKDYAFAHEAGVYDKAHDAVWVTSNLLDPTVHGSKVQLHRIDLQSGEATLIETSSIAAANGACALDDGVLLCDQGSATEPSQLVLVDFASHSARPVLNNFHGRHFNSLNDVIVLPAKGSEPSTSSTPGATVWFTDPPYGHEQSFRPQPQLPPHVYVWTLQTGAVRVAADGFQHPNGIAFSPDGKICYVTDTSHIHGTGQLNPALQSTMWVGLFISLLTVAMRLTLYTAHTNRIPQLD